MNTNTWKAEGSTGSTIDSFETNLLQIEQTNRLLANIENKLNNFFQKGSNAYQPSPLKTQERSQKDQVYQEQKRLTLEKQEDSVPDIGNTMLSPIQNKDSIQHFLSAEGEINLKMSPKYIHIVDTSKPYDTNATYSEQDTSSYAYKSSDPIVSTNPGNGRDKYDISVQNGTYSSPTRRSVERRENEERDRMDSIWVPQEERARANGRRAERNKSIESSEERSSDIDRRFYEKKVRILEERLENAEKEVNNLVKIKGSLNSEIIRLRAQLSESETKFIGELSRSLKGQEERLRREFEAQSKYKEAEQIETIEYVEKIESLNREKNLIQQDYVDLKRQYARLLDEKERLEMQQNTLLHSHNHEAHRNERSLKNSISGQLSDGRPSVARSQDGRIQTEQLKILIETLNMYKHELETIKHNNTMIQSQFEQEVHQLREELEGQKEENSKLVEKVQEQQHALAKVHQSNPESSNKGLLHGRSGSVPVHVMEFSEERPSQHEQRRTFGREGDERYKTSGEYSHKNMRRNKDAGSPDKALEEKQTYFESHRNNTSPERVPTGDFRKEIPFTNPEIKSGLMTQEKERERKGRGREALYRELAELHSTPPKVMTVRNKSRSKTRSKSKSGNRRYSEDEQFKVKSDRKIQNAQKSPGTAYEEFEEELKRLKGAMKKGSRKDSKSKVDKENVGKGERRASKDKVLKKDPSEKKFSASTSGVRKSSPAVNKSAKALPSSRPKTAKKT